MDNAGPPTDGDGEAERIGDAFRAAVALQQARRFPEALTAYEQLLAEAPGHADALYNAGLIHKAGGAFDRALELWRRPALQRTLHAQLAIARLLAETGRLQEAARALDGTLTVWSDNADALSLRGAVSHRLGRLEEALAFLDASLVRRPEGAAALAARGDVLSKLGDLEAGIDSYRRALAADPSLVHVYGAKFYRQLQICDWSDFDTARGAIAQRLDQGQPAALPFTLCAYSGSGEAQLKAARAHRRIRLPTAFAPLWTGQMPAHRRLRIGYVSPELRNHATATLAAGLFEEHDTERFQIFAYALAPRANDPMRARLRAAIPDFHDVADLNDDQVARLMRQHEIDIAVDLGGYTDNSAPGIFARRCAPVQINYLTYPATLGAEFMDYILADRQVIPDGFERFYDEKVIRLPHSYQVNDRLGDLPPETFTREMAGLPQDGFVFCCFNASHKIMPEIFDLWMRLLSKVDGSVLWLLDANPVLSRNLRAEAGKRGVDPARLVFAPKVGHQAHMDRHRLADLFLDTTPFNAHTTASDALRMGLPLVTCPGEPFAARVAASILCAAGLPELVTGTLGAYEALAEDLARDPARLAALKARVRDSIATAPLFNTVLSARHIEAAYEEAWARRRRGEAPSAFDVPA